jgi:ABC-type lipoprotein export system ATPase subunit/bifunctional DNA-binding transcriptional regulator/antitoxin component of YhaV-PrlF toxin-antitoxin module
MMGSEPLIVCESLVKIYRLTPDLPGKSGGGSVEVQALQGMDITVAEGEMLGIVGASGSGKSTLLNVLGGLDRPTGGRALVGKQDLGQLSAGEIDEYRRKTVGFVWQQGARNLIPYLTALENIELPLTLSGQVGKATRERALKLLDLVGLRERKDHRLEELSGGEQQRIAVAIALANRPKLLLADEPTGELDTATAQTIYDLLRKLNKQLGLTMVIVSHDPGIARHVDRVVAVRDGKLASETLRVQKSDSDEHHLVELAVVDAAGRLQIPREYLEQLNIRRRVQVELTEQGILIRPPEKEHHSHDHVASSGNDETAEPETAEVSSGLSKVWQSIKSRFARAAKHSNGDGQ